MKIKRINKPTFNRTHQSFAANEQHVINLKQCKGANLQRNLIHFITRHIFSKTIKQQLFKIMTQIVI